MRGSKAKDTDKQKRQARHVEAGYEERGAPKKEAAGRAYATVNKESGGGKTAGSGRGKKRTTIGAKRGARISGATRTTRRAGSGVAKRKSATKAAATRKPKSASRAAPARKAIAKRKRMVAVKRATARKPTSRRSPAR